MSSVKLDEYKQALGEGYHVLKALEYSTPMTFIVNVVYINTVWKKMLVEIPEDEFNYFFGHIPVNVTGLTSPIQSSKHAGFVVFQVNLKQSQGLDVSKIQKGQHQITVKPEIYVGYKVKDEVKSGWFLKLNSIQMIST
jgi:hypothetical protein